jgi:tRNA 2-thiouridine synthesizing protein A
MGEIAVDQTLDCRGLNCPLPILKTKKAIDGMSSGQVLKMISTDPGSLNDVIAWTQRTGNELLESAQSGNEYTYLIRKK